LCSSISLVKASLPVINCPQTSQHINSNEPAGHAAALHTRWGKSRLSAVCWLRLGFFKVLWLLFHLFVTSDAVVGQEILLLLILKHIVN